MAAVHYCHGAAKQAQIITPLPIVFHVFLGVCSDQLFGLFQREPCIMSKPPHLFRGDLANTVGSVVHSNATFQTSPLLLYSFHKKRVFLLTRFPK